MVVKKNWKFKDTQAQIGPETRIAGTQLLILSSCLWEDR